EEVEIPAARPVGGLAVADLVEDAAGVTRGRRVEAATRLGIGRNTITRKLQELGFD
ncbi:helix-turn-helix domain-containing protein, partial [Ralstonia pseudosolanacearum]|uniref:helix-turn-helix domain-containing protein n=1 Tax=Ralstonia pseudosolanacearum TaxID=1310165 RepID=UPI003D170F58